MYCPLSFVNAAVISYGRPCGMYVHLPADITKLFMLPWCHIRLIAKLQLCVGIDIFETDNVQCTSMLWCLFSLNYLFPWFHLVTLIG